MDNRFYKSPAAGPPWPAAPLPASRMHVPRPAARFALTPVALVAAALLAPAGALAQARDPSPVLKPTPRLREDIPAKSVGDERPQAPPTAGNEVLGVKISHPERVIWPKLGVKKIELARYIEAVGERLLPHPRSVVRGENLTTRSAAARRPTGR